MTKLRAISLFTGAGGLDFGFEAAGYETTVALEMDARCVETLRANRSWPVIDRDIMRVPTGDLLKAGRLKPGQADVLIGGPPCQPFSKSGFWASGEAGRLNDPRAGTLGAYLRVLEAARPRAFLLENVEGLGFRGKDEGLKLIRSELMRINAAHGTRYEPSIAVLNAADYGVPQLRRRLFVIGARDGSGFDFPLPSHVDPAKAAASDNDHVIIRRGMRSMTWIQPTHLSRPKANGLACCLPSRRARTTSGTPIAAAASRCSAGGGATGRSSSSSPRRSRPGRFRRSRVPPPDRSTGQADG
jgi:DNA-cytosine methyltransferase